MPITYLTGDATARLGAGPKIIAHICNDACGWGAGFVLAISRRWREPEAAYRAWYRNGTHPDVYGLNKSFGLGQVQFVSVAPDLWVANMVAQKGYGKQGKDPHKTGEESGPLVQYDFLTQCLQRVGDMADRNLASVHMPRIGCNLGGGSWAKIEPIIENTLKGKQIFVYDFPGSRFNP